MEHYDHAAAFRDFINARPANFEANASDYEKGAYGLDAWPQLIHDLEKRHPFPRGRQMADEAGLTLLHEATSDGTVVYCRGRVILSTADELKRDVKPLIVHGGHIVLDLSEVTFMDSMGLGTIASLWVSSKNAGCQLTLVNLTRRLRDLFTMTHLLSLFEACGETNAQIP
jgi:anti-sigma B factor antagonist